MITLTEKAVMKAKELVQSGLERLIREKSVNVDEKDKYGLRFAVQGGGCSGLLYQVSIDKPVEGDKMQAYDGLTVLVDFKSYLYLSSVIVDYEETLGRSGFVFNNPQSKGSCGCGESFSV